MVLKFGWAELHRALKTITKIIPAPKSMDRVIKILLLTMRFRIRIKYLSISLDSLAQPKANPKHGKQNDNMRQINQKIMHTKIYSPEWFSEKITI